MSSEHDFQVLLALAATHPLVSRALAERIPRGAARSMSDLLRVTIMHSLDPTSPEAAP